MGWYSRHIFPRLLDWAMSHPPLAEQRKLALAAAAGDVLEIGFGTGLNLPHYPPHVRRLAVLDPNPGAARIACRRAAASPIRVEWVDLRDGREVGAGDGSFDTVVSTWTLCSIADVSHALAEVARVLRPGGQLLFVEHGLAPDPAVARWQRRLTPLQRRVADGCHLDRDVVGLLGASPLHAEACERFYLPGTPRVAGYTYRGLARKGSGDGDGC